MSAFDDEFGLFSEDVQSERRPTLGARKIVSNDAFTDDFDPEEERVRKPGRPERGKPPRRRGGPEDPVAAQKRAADLLGFLAKRLVTKPDAITVETFPAENGEPPGIEMAVDSEDIGKVIGRNGRVAQALRTVVRATAEGPVSVEI